jgi:hypothetical protein
MEREVLKFIQGFFLKKGRQRGPLVTRRMAVGVGQLAVRSATWRTAVAMGRTAVAIRSGGPAVRRVPSGRVFFYIRQTARPSASLLLFYLPWQERLGAGLSRG